MYSDLKDGVSDKMEARVSVRMAKKTIVVTVPTPVIKATAREKAGALEALEAIRKLFGKGGKHWIKGQYHTIRGSFDAFCLAGGMNKVDGNYEAIARLALSTAIIELYPDVLEEGDDLETLAQVRSAVLNEGTITGFNDSSYTEWADVLKVLKRAKELLS